MQYAGLRSYLGRIGLPEQCVESLVPEEQGSDYAAAVLNVGARRWRIRIARVTPAKPGAFVAVWRRDAEGRTQPFACAAQLADLLVFVGENEHAGVFHFTPERQVELGIVSSARHPGKRGFRLYPPWCTELNAQAQRTQRLQLPSFIAL